MQVRVGVAGEVVVDGQVDAFDVDAAAEDIGGDADALVEFFEFFVPFDSGGGD
jgi:hypothetical protein